MRVTEVAVEPHRRCLKGVETIFDKMLEEVDSDVEIQN